MSSGENNLTNKESAEPSSSGKAPLPNPHRSSAAGDHSNASNATSSNNVQQQSQGLTKVYVKDNTKSEKELGKSKITSESNDLQKNKKKPNRFKELLHRMTFGFFRHKAIEECHKRLSAPTFDAVVEYIKSGKCKRICTMAGAGISTSAGIPDFRSPNSGIYANMGKYHLPHPQAMFEIHYFKMFPRPFYALAKELWPERFQPTPCHFFLKLLNDKGLLLRHFTQNVDGLSRTAGLPKKKVVEAHGTLHASRCIRCGHPYSKKFMKEKIFADEIPQCTQDRCKGLIKPDVVFFGEALPMEFFTASYDLRKCDLLIILGTSLVVQPFASLVDDVSRDTPRLLVNREKATGSSNIFMRMIGFGSNGLKFDCQNNYRDVFWEGSTDDFAREMARRLGWEAELEELIANAPAADFMADDF